MNRVFHFADMKAVYEITGQPVTIKDLMAYTGIDYRTITDNLYQWHKAGSIHIAAWSRSASHLHAHFAPFEGDDAPKPDRAVRKDGFGQAANKWGATSETVIRRIQQENAAIERRAAQQKAALWAKVSPHLEAVKAREAEIAQYAREQRERERLIRKAKQAAARRNEKLASRQRPRQNRRLPALTLAGQLAGLTRSS